jgi:hypothetical protein
MAKGELCSQCGLAVCNCKGCGIFLARERASAPGLGALRNANHFALSTSVMRRPTRSLLLANGNFPRLGRSLLFVCPGSFASRPRGRVQTGLDCLGRFRGRGKERESEVESEVQV